jgi:hypothetical protein
MPEPDSAPDPRGGVPRFRRPAPLIFEPSESTENSERFFDLDEITDPRELLDRSTELALAFSAAADRAVEFQAMAAAQLADPKRFDRLSDAAIAKQADWAEDYARKMIEFGRELLADQGPQ